MIVSISAGLYCYQNYLPPLEPQERRPYEQDWMRPWKNDETFSVVKIEESASGLDWQKVVVLRKKDGAPFSGYCFEGQKLELNQEVNLFLLQSWYSDGSLNEVLIIKAKPPNNASGDKDTHSK